MKILAYKPGHDGHVALVENGTLRFSIEAEKDSGPRYGPITPELIFHGLSLAGSIPDVLAISGWMRSFRPMADPIGAGYFGVTGASCSEEPYRLLGKNVRLFSSSHERSHIIGCHSMSPFPVGEPCYALVWEGVIGSFYRIDEKLNVTCLGTPMTGPGHKYGFVYALADPTYPVEARKSRREDAGKLMALAGYGDARSAPGAGEARLIERLFSWDAGKAPLRKADFIDAPYFNAGLHNQEFRNFARRFQTAIFDHFFRFAEQSMREKLPLLISGGCGLNCDWNSMWRGCGLFSDTFVQPCANDSGSAIGTAADAMRYYTDQSKLDWSVYTGEEFVSDEADMSGFKAAPLDLGDLAARLESGAIFAWVQGRYEIGPRALGNRSLIAAPFTAEIHKRLNAIKKREEFRPIAPILMEEELDVWFNHQGPSPHMLYFQSLKTDALMAVTHVDGSARAQTVNATQNPKMYELLARFREKTGFGVLCNTSLNFSGKGFINRTSDLVQYARETGLDGFVIGNELYRRV